MKYFVSAFCLLLALVAQAQETKRDTIKLPFAIAKEKKLSDEDLKEKKVGTYVAGVPDIGSDPVNGFEYGLEGSIFFNGKRSDPFFEYTPYRAELGVELSNSTKDQRKFIVKTDIPYIFDSKWRLRAEAGYESNPNLLYFGQTEKSLEGLSYYPNGDTTQPKVYNATYDEYYNNLPADSKNFNTYFKKEYILNASLERSFYEGRLRVLGGFEIANVDITTFPGQSLLQQENAISPVNGLGRNTFTLFQVGLIYDTRDLETDPNSGIFSELTNELSMKVLGSHSDFNKTFFHINGFQRLFPNTFGKMVLAGRFAYGYTAGNAPFFEYQDQWSSEGSIEGLGGAHTLRGYKQGRFLARAMNFNNIELRTRFAQTDFLKQHFAFSAVPFFDMGGVWDELKNSFSFNNYRFSSGLGLRIAWNVNTILRFDYAVSKEDKQFFFSLAHAF